MASRLISFLFFCFSVSQLFGEIRGLVLLKEEKDLLGREELKGISGICLEGIDLPGSFKEFTRQLEPVYLNKKWDKETISAIKKKIYDYYQENRRPFIVISIPGPQNQQSDVLQIVVKESLLGKIEITGNQWTVSERFKKYLKIRPGDPICMRQLSKEVHFINRNPFRFVNLIYSPGEKDHTTDLTLEVHDRRPYRFYAGFDNTGVLATGRQRVFAGFSWDQVFGLDHVFSYQYTTNYNGRRFHANTFQYLALLPYQAVLNLYGGYSLVRSTIPSPNRTNKGTNIQASLRYQMPLDPYPFYSHETELGFDIKNTNNDMEFVDFSPTFGQTVNLTQIILGYRGKWEKERKIFEGAFEFTFSPGAWLPNQTDADFSSLRPSAKNTWAYATVFLRARGPLSSFSYDMSFRGQLSSQVLLPSEQLPLGGYASVRGYDERQFNADSGFFCQLELHSPHFPVVRRSPSRQDELYFLLFLDGAYGIDKVPVPQINPDESLVSIGPGIRYLLSPYLTARCDWGIKLHQQASFTGGGSMLHFSVIGSF